MLCCAQKLQVFEGKFRKKLEGERDKMSEQLE